MFHLMIVRGGRRRQGALRRRELLHREANPERNPEHGGNRPDGPGRAFCRRAAPIVVTDLL